MSSKEKVHKIYRYWITLDDGDWNYVGQTTATCRSRRCGNIETGSDYQRSSKFWTAIQQYGFPNFNYEVLWETTDPLEANQLEEMTIDILNSIEHGFNTTSGGQNGISPSEESRKRQAEAKGVFGVRQLDKQGQVINEYYSLREAERQTGIFHGSISKCCSGKVKTAGGYIFQLI